MTRQPVIQSTKKKRQFRRVAVTGLTTGVELQTLQTEQSTGCCRSRRVDGLGLASCTVRTAFDASNDSSGIDIRRLFLNETSRQMNQPRVVDCIDVLE